MNRFVYLYVCLIQLNKLFVLEHYNYFVEKKVLKIQVSDSFFHKANPGSGSASS